ALPNDTVEYEYDAVGNLTAVRDNDSSLAYEYDAAGRLLAVTTGGSIQPQVRLEQRYDGYAQTRLIARLVNDT
ncbi:MAG: RHS repeat protein, partial [Gammaproteobacteria bacterium]|nr:RHS repeat protein [Gammaproteobacteria bacterium]NIU03233.1 RHS repeat protein [Gammaproteobacteria bacterium]NIV50722.1 hypothetical protein [Gammaproteobacteria bacterium]NIX84508.1 hypothetical protein [Gammaproteobacteria bacterium]